LVLVSTQLSPHSRVPAAHIVLQTPAEQTCMLPQVMPQPPQFLGSLSVLAHEFPQRVPLGQAHCPAVHTRPAGQRTPQAPQLALLLVRFTHAFPQVVNPAPHWAVQTP
jgi:hypothetical protein